MTPAAPPPPPRPAREDERLTALHRYRILDSGVEVDFDDVAALAASLTDCPVALVSLVDEGRAWFKARVGLDVDEAPRDLAFCSWAVAAPDQPLRIPDLRADDRFATNPLVAGPAGFRSYTGVPLVTSDGHALGTVCVLDHEQRELTDDQVTGLERLARTVMSHIEARRVAHALLSVTEVLDEVRELQQVPDLESLSSGAGQLLSRVLDAEHGELRLPEQIEDPAALFGGRLLLKPSTGASGLSSELHLPLVRAGSLLGVLVARWTRSVTEVDGTVERVLEVLAHETAYALSALDDRRLLRVQAETDALTGLSNRRAGEALLRSWPSSAFAMIDLDHFKRVNDTHGHAAGDAVLRCVAVALARHSRAGDLLCRWGGEEFLVALRDGTAPALETLLGRVQQELATSGTTFSAGLAVRAPHEALRDALARADGALYRAKSEGRARSLLAPPAAEAPQQRQPEQARTERPPVVLLA